MTIRGVGGTVAPTEWVPEPRPRATKEHNDEHQRQHRRPPGRRHGRSPPGMVPVAGRGPAQVGRVRGPLHVHGPRTAAGRRNRAADGRRQRCRRGRSLHRRRRGRRLRRDGLPGQVQGQGPARHGELPGERTAGLAPDDRSVVRSLPGRGIERENRPANRGDPFAESRRLHSDRPAGSLQQRRPMDRAGGGLGTGGQAGLR